MSVAEGTTEVMNDCCHQFNVLSLQLVCTGAAGTGQLVEARHHALTGTDLVDLSGAALRCLMNYPHHVHNGIRTLS